MSKSKSTLVEVLDLILHRMDSPEKGVEIERLKRQGYLAVYLRRYEDLLSDSRLSTSSFHAGLMELTKLGVVSKFRRVRRGGTIYIVGRAHPRSGEKTYIPGHLVLDLLSKIRVWNSRIYSRKLEEEIYRSTLYLRLIHSALDHLGEFEGIEDQISWLWEAFQGSQKRRQFYLRKSSSFPNRKEIVFALKRVLQTSGLLPKLNTPEDCQKFFWRISKSKDFSSDPLKGILLEICGHKFQKERSLYEKLLRGETPGSSPPKRIARKRVIKSRRKVSSNSQRIPPSQSPRKSHSERVKKSPAMKTPQQRQVASLLSAVRMGYGEICQRSLKRHANKSTLIKATELVHDVSQAHNLDLQPILLCVMAWKKRRIRDERYILPYTWFGTGDYQSMVWRTAEAFKEMRDLRSNLKDWEWYQAWEEVAVRIMSPRIGNPLRLGGRYMEEFNRWCLWKGLLKHWKFQPEFEHANGLEMTWEFYLLAQCQYLRDQYTSRRRPDLHIPDLMDISSEGAVLRATAWVTSNESWSKITPERERELRERFKRADRRWTDRTTKHGKQWVS